MDPNTASLFFFVVICAGVMSAFVYILMGMVESSVLKKYGLQMSYIPEARFQTRLGHLAMVAAIGYLVAGVFSPEEMVVGAYLTFGFSGYLFLAGCGRFKNAYVIKSQNNKKYLKP